MFPPEPTEAASILASKQPGTLVEADVALMYTMSPTAVRKVRDRIELATTFRSWVSPPPLLVIVSIQLHEEAN